MSVHPAPSAPPPRAHGIQRRMSVKELAEVCGVIPKTIYRWRKRGKLPPCHLLPSGDIVWDPRDVERWLESRKG